MTFWYMQVHPGSQPREFNAEVMRASILRTHDVGIGDESRWGVDGLATQARFKNDVQIGDVAVIAHGKKLMMLVRFGRHGRNRNISDDGHHWYGFKRDVDILSADPAPYALEFTKCFGVAAADGLPIRQTLARVKSNKFVKFWYDQVCSGTRRKRCPEQVAPEQSEIAARTSWKRRFDVVEKAKRKGVCELCGKEKTFLKDDGTQYFEGHHLIPMSLQGLFSISLDVDANVVCLCPECRRFLHYGQEGKRKSCLSELYLSRAKALARSGLVKTKSQFVSRALER